MLIHVPVFLSVLPTSRQCGKKSMESAVLEWTCPIEMLLWNRIVSTLLPNPVYNCLESFRFRYIFLFQRAVRFDITQQSNSNWQGNQSHMLLILLQLMRVMPLQRMVLCCTTSKAAATIKQHTFAVSSQPPIIPCVLYERQHRRL